MKVPDSESVCQCHAGSSPRPYIDNSGSLSYKEFAGAFKTLSYGLSDNDIKTLIALADDNNDEKITWEEFIPVAIDSIKTFFARNKAL